MSGFVVPRADEHQNEYVPANAERLLWLTGFSGSAGTAIVLDDKAALFIDGRYTEQVKSETDRAIFDLRHVSQDSPTEWLGRNLKAGDKVGYDPSLHTPDAVEKFPQAVKKAGAEFVALSGNPIDRVWRDRPSSPVGTITLHRSRYAGESASAKLARVREAMKGVDGLLITDPHNLAWIFNIRGADVSHTPIPLGFAYVPAAGQPAVFFKAAKLSPSAGESLASQTTLHDPDTLASFVEKLGRQGLRVAFNSATVPAALTQTLERAGGKAEIGPDPITLMKAAKNKAELAGSRAAHERDGACFARFLRGSMSRPRAADLPRSMRSRRSRHSAAQAGCLRTYRFPRSQAPARIRPFPTIGSVKRRTARSNAESS